jgi:hypothetical protein
MTNIKELEGKICGSCYWFKKNYCVSKTENAEAKPCILFLDKNDLILQEKPKKIKYASPGFGGHWM